MTYAFIRGSGKLGVRAALAALVSLAFIPVCLFLFGLSEGQALSREHFFLIAALSVFSMVCALRHGSPHAVASWTVSCVAVAIIASGKGGIDSRDLIGALELFAGYSLLIEARVSVGFFFIAGAAELLLQGSLLRFLACCFLGFVGAKIGMLLPQEIIRPLKIIRPLGQKLIGLLSAGYLVTCTYFAVIYNLIYISYPQVAFVGVVPDSPPAFWDFFYLSGAILLAGETPGLSPGNWMSQLGYLAEVALGIFWLAIYVSAVFIHIQSSNEPSSSRAQRSKK